MRLILFSGGVESTALLTNAQAGDIALTILPTYGSDKPSFREDTTLKIARYFNIPQMYAKATLPDFGSFGFVHQMSVFVSICNIIVAREKNITEIWCGRNSAEPSDDILDYIERNMKAWNILNPEVAFNHPLDHLSKKEQMDLIPDEIKPLVSSCLYHNACGQCFKCKEYEWNY